MEALGLENIWGEQEIDNLFSDTEESPSGAEEDGAGEPASEDNNNDEKTTEVTADSLFDDSVQEEPESVGSEKNEAQVKGDSSTDSGGDTSPENFYSSIAIAMAEDDIFPNLDEETVKKVSTAEGLSDLIEAEVLARLDDKQQRIAKALDNGVPADDIRQYENVLNNLSKVTDAMLSEESAQGEQIRRDLIYHDLLNRGYKPDVAQKKTERIIDGGTDIEDAKEALQSNKDFYQKQYDSLLEEARIKADEAKATRQKESEKLKDSILKDKTLMGDMDISQDVRKKIFDSISKPVYKDPETGAYMTSVQKYEMEHRADFLKYVGLFYTLTNGFKDFKSFTKAEVKREVRKGLSQLEKTLGNTRRDSNGSLKMQTSVQDDPESYLGKGWKLDL